jgi:hypothetical protein
MFKKMAQGIKDFFQRLYGVALVLYFGGIITAAIALSVVFPFIAPVVLTAAAAVFVVSCFVLAAIQNTANAFFGLFQRSKPAAEVTVASSTIVFENAPVASSTAKVTSALAGEKKAQATETVLINKNTTEANEVRKTHTKGAALFVPAAGSKVELEQDITANSSMKAA